MTGDFDKEMLRLLETCGLGGGVVLDYEYDAGHFGNASLAYQRGAVYVRVDRDRGETLVVFGSSRDTADQFLLEDVGIALGWWTVAAAAARPTRLTVVEQLALVAEHWSEVEQLFAETPPDHLIERLHAIARDRAKLEFG